MDLKRALNILNLNENYTEEELKKAYRSLIVKYHPDKHSDDKKTYAEEKSKQINEAKDILEHNLKNKKLNENKSNQEELNKIKIRILRIQKEILTEQKEINSINSLDKLFTPYKDKLLRILNETYTRIQYKDNIINIEKEYQTFKNQYRELLMEYCYDFTKSSDIFLWDIQYYRTLKEIRNYIIDCINEDLEFELYGFSYHKYYNEIIPLITEIQQTYMLTCLYGHRNINIITQLFKNKIEQELKEYEIRKKIINKLKSHPNIGKNKKHIIIDLECVILDKEKFYSIYSQINISTKFQCKIKKLLNK